MTGHNANDGAAGPLYGTLPIIVVLGVVLYISVSLFKLEVRYLGAPAVIALAALSIVSGR
jgi:uncharacterized membrane protein YqiK